MGRASARLFGLTHDLLLTDLAAPALASFVDDLMREGYVIHAGVPGDLANDEVLATIVNNLPDDVHFVLVHAAGLSPALADWRAIMSVNLVGTEKLLRTLETKLVPGSVAILIASIAGHMMREIAEADALMKDPIAAGFLDRIGALIAREVEGEGRAPAMSYMLSKRANLAQCEDRASKWGSKGARIVSISPGMILTPRGRQEMEKTPGAYQMIDMAPAGRAGVAGDIAQAAHFLASDQASFITGCDLRVDGGTMAFMKSMGA